MRLRFYKREEDVVINTASDMNILHLHLWLEDLDTPTVYTGINSKSYFGVWANSEEDIKFFVSDIVNVVQFPLPADEDPKHIQNVHYESSFTYHILFHYKKGMFWESDEAKKIQNLFVATLLETFPETSLQGFCLKYNNKKLVNICYWPGALDARFSCPLDYETYDKTVNKDFLFSQTGFSSGRDIHIGLDEVYPNADPQDFIARFVSSFATKLGLEGVYEDIQGVSELQKQKAVLAAAFINPKDVLNCTEDLRLDSVVEIPAHLCGSDVPVKKVSLMSEASVEGIPVSTTASVVVDDSEEFQHGLT